MAFMRSPLKMSQQDPFDDPIQSKDSEKQRKGQTIGLRETHE